MVRHVPVTKNFILKTFLLVENVTKALLDNLVRLSSVLWVLCSYVMFGDVVA